MAGTDIVRFVVGVIHRIAWFVALGFAFGLLHLYVLDQTPHIVLPSNTWFLVSAFVLLVALHYLEKYLANLKRERVRHPHKHKRHRRHGRASQENASG